MIYYRTFKCGRCHRTLSQKSRGGPVFDGHHVIDTVEVADCASCLAWYTGQAPFKAKRTGES